MALYIYSNIYSETEKEMFTPLTSVASGPNKDYDFCEGK
jgi:hypothetical protein